MINQNLKSYSWAVPHLLISVCLAVYAGTGNAAKENRTVSTHSPATSPMTVFHTNGMSLEPLPPSVSQSPSREKAKEGEMVTLGCRFQSPHGSSLNNLTVKWYKVDEKGSRTLMENNNTVLANYTRAFLTGDLSEGDASLTILNVTISDHGTYFCQVTLYNGDVVTGGGTKLRIRRALGLFGIEESIGTIIGVVAAGIGGLLVLIVVLTPQLRKCLPCAKATSNQV